MDTAHCQYSLDLNEAPPHPLKGSPLDQQQMLKADAGCQAHCAWAKDRKRSGAAVHAAQRFLLCLFARGRRPGCLGHSCFGADSSALVHGKVGASAMLKRIQFCCALFLSDILARGA
jgi:hypothetical protein